MVALNDSGTAGPVDTGDTDNRLVAAVAGLRERFGDAVLRDRRKLTNILADIVPDAHRSVLLLGIAVGDGMPGELQRAQPETLPFEIRRLAGRMEDLYAIRPDLALWTVALWCRILGVAAAESGGRDAIGDFWDDDPAQAGTNSIDASSGALMPTAPSMPPKPGFSARTIASLLITAIVVLACIWFFRTP